MPCQKLFVLTAAVALVIVVAPAPAQNEAPAERGKYLVESVGACQTCHTAKLESGELDKSKWLKGAELDIQPLTTIPKWHKKAPDLTASSDLFKRWGPEGLVKFLETAKNPRGNPADPPMPAYHMTHADAVAVVEYLKTLP